MKHFIVYELEHVYFINKIYKEGKRLGFFSSKKEAESAIDQFISLPGFKDYPRKCFKINKHIVDDYDKWKNGFIEDELELLY